MQFYINGSNYTVILAEPYGPQEAGPMGYFQEMAVPSADSMDYFKDENGKPVGRHFGPKGFMVKFRALPRMYDTDEDPRLKHDKQLKAFVERKLLAHPALGRDFFRHIPPKPKVTIDAEEYRRLKEKDGKKELSEKDGKKELSLSGASQG